MRARRCRACRAAAHAACCREVRGHSSPHSPSPVCSSTTGAVLEIVATHTSPGLQGQGGEGQGCSVRRLGGGAGTIHVYHAPTPAESIGGGLAYGGAAKLRGWSLSVMQAGLARGRQDRGVVGRLRPVQHAQRQATHRLPPAALAATPRLRALPRPPPMLGRRGPAVRGPALKPLPCSSAQGVAMP